MFSVKLKGVYKERKIYDILYFIQLYNIEYQIYQEVWGNVFVLFFILE